MAEVQWCLWLDCLSSIIGIHIFIKHKVIVSLKVSWFFLAFHDIPQAYTLPSIKIFSLTFSAFKGLTCSGSVHLNNNLIKRNLIAMHFCLTAQSLQKYFMLVKDEFSWSLWKETTLGDCYLRARTLNNSSLLRVFHQFIDKSIGTHHFSHWRLV